MADFSYELDLWKKGYKLVVGVDEVGRGAFAGPVVAGAVSLRIKNQELRIMEKETTRVCKLGINDSKKLSQKKREKLDQEIRKYFHCAVGEGSVSEINRFGIKLATEKAMRRAVVKLLCLICYGEHGKDKTLRVNDVPKTCLLVDAFHVRYVTGIGLSNQKPLVNGDTRSVSIAAASIAAKVYRDSLMQKLSKRCQKYQWHNNMGYGTKKHRRALKKYGATKYHREKFIRNWID